MLIDSDVLILYTRGNLAAAQCLNAIPQWQLSIVTYMELAQGCSDKLNLARLKKGLTQRKVQILPITTAISLRAAWPMP
jgi:predicted nucleic acid-binding protein